MNAIIYIRDGKYRHKNSIEIQRKACYQYAAEHGYDVIDEYISEDMISNRNILEDLIQKCKTKKVCIILAYNNKLISYPAPILAMERMMIMQNHISLICVNHTTDPASLLLENIIMNFIQYQRAEHSAKVRRGMQLAKERKATLAAKTEAA